MDLPFSVTMTRKPMRPVPSNVGVESLVMPLFGMSPVLPATLSTARRTLRVWLSASSLKLKVSASLSLPAASRAVTLSVRSPLVSARVGVSDQLPLESTTALPMMVLPSRAMMVSPAVAPSPTNVGVASSVVSPPFNWPNLAPTSSLTVNDGFWGAWVSTTTRYAPESAPRWAVPLKRRATRSLLPRSSCEVVMAH